MSDRLAYDLDSLAVDVFSLVENAGTVESLTGAHGMTELAASCPCFQGWEWIACSGSCSAEAGAA